MKEMKGEEMVGEGGKEEIKKKERIKRSIKLNQYLYIGYIDNMNII